MPSLCDLERHALCMAAVSYARAAYGDEETRRRVERAREVLALSLTGAEQTEQFRDAAEELARLTLLHAGQSAP